MPNDDGELTPTESHLVGLKSEKAALEHRIKAGEESRGGQDLKDRLKGVAEQIGIYEKGDPQTTAAKRGGARTTAARTSAPDED